LFEISDKSIEEIILKNRFDPVVGGVVTFEGRVRNHNDGHKVKSLEYQAFEEMALVEGNKIVKEALEVFGIEQLFCVHRTGHLKISDLAIWIYAASKHRKEAFLACQYTIDEIKKRVPVWKREHYQDLEPQWVQCHH